MLQKVILCFVFQTTDNHVKHFTTPLFIKWRFVSGSEWYTCLKKGARGNSVFHMS